MSQVSELSGRAPLGRIVESGVSVVICAYTLNRWDLLCRAVASVAAQSALPLELVLCIDHNPELAEKCRAEFLDQSIPVVVVENRYEGRLGSARNTAVEIVRGAVVAFLDDDAAADFDWLQNLQETYAREPFAMIVGGAPRPRYAVPKPAWFPDEFHWVFGCAYKGLPDSRQPVRHVIGACMAVRREALVRVGGYHSDNHDDMDICHRVAHQFGRESVLYDPAIQVSHFVGAERVTWAYFWRRCYSVNRGKVAAFEEMEGASNIRAEVAFALRSILVVIPRYMLSGRPGGLARAAVTAAGLALATAGHVRGRIDHYLGKGTASRTRGIGQVVTDDGARSVF